MKSILAARFKLFLHIFLLCSVCSLSSCSKATTPQTDRLRKEIGQRYFDLISSPDSVSIRGMTPPSPERDLSQIEIEELQAILLNDSHYIFDVRKKTIFLPSYAFTFQKGKDVTLITINLPSAQIKFSENQRSIIIDNDPSRDLIENFIESLKL